MLLRIHTQICYLNDEYEFKYDILRRTNRGEDYKVIHSYYLTTLNQYEHLGKLVFSKLQEKDQESIKIIFESKAEVQQKWGVKAHPSFPYIVIKPSGRIILNSQKLKVTGYSENGSCFVKNKLINKQELNRILLALCRSKNIPVIPGDRII